MDPNAYTNLIYLYDLPKEETSSTKIALLLKDIADVTHLDAKPQIIKDISRPFYTAIVSIKDAEAYERACKRMRYFELERKPCRALPFDRSLLGGNNRERLMATNVFVKLPRSGLDVVGHRQLEAIFDSCGKIRSLKVSLNSDYSSRGYGFICFEDEQGAQRALQSKVTIEGRAPESPDDEKDVLIVAKFQPKEGRKQYSRLINNVYVKNLPQGFTEGELRKLFEAYGSIKSLALRSNQIGTFGFVCFEDPRGASKNYGPECAQKAIDGLNGFDVSSVSASESSDGSAMSKLVVRHALKSSERMVEKLREAMSYKASKRRCNLYVKGFPVDWTKE